ncbi:peptidoglycan binding domain-containing protein [Colletotrichum higginsianum]|nr:peptidoglycan binding domain-containing protein [Colletotrichum higginsianum]
MPQVVYYHRGAGTEESKVAQYLGGVLGKGVVQDIADIYRFVCDNYNPGDEIFILGFSRGAFTARSVSGLICNLGLLNRVGLSHFGAIFHDYQNFPNWRPFTWFDKEKHLAGFTLSNYERLERFERAREGRTERRDNAAMEADLDEEKKKFFKSMTQCRDPETMQMNLQKMAKKYRDLLEKV